MRFHEKKVHLINRGKNSAEILFRAGFSTHFLWWKPVLANLSQVAPSCAKFHLSYAKDTLFSQLFPIYDMNEPSWAMLKNMVFGSYLLNRWTNWKNPCRGNIYLVPYINQHHRFFCTLAKSLENFSLWAKNGHLAKILRWFSFFCIDRPS